MVGVKGLARTTLACRLRAKRDDFGALSFPKSTYFQTRGFSSKHHNPKLKPGQTRFKFLVGVKGLKPLTLSV